MDAETKAYEWPESKLEEYLITWEGINRPDVRGRYFDYEIDEWKKHNRRFRINNGIWWQIMPKGADIESPLCELGFEKKKATDEGCSRATVFTKGQIKIEIYYIEGTELQRLKKKVENEIGYKNVITYQLVKSASDEDMMFMVTFRIKDISYVVRPGCAFKHIPAFFTSFVAFAENVVREYEETISKQAARIRKRMEVATMATEVIMKDVMTELGIKAKTKNDNESVKFETKIKSGRRLEVNIPNQTVEELKNFKERFSRMMKAAIGLKRMFFTSEIKQKSDKITGMRYKFNFECDKTQDPMDEMDTIRELIDAMRSIRVYWFRVVKG